MATTDVQRTAFSIPETLFNMCYNYRNKCIQHFPVKKICFILSIINAVAHGLLLVWWFYIWYRYNSYYPEEYDSDHCGSKLGGICSGRQGRHERDAIDEYLHNGWWFLPVTFFLTLLTFCSVIFFTTSVLLCYGIFKCRPGLLMAYYVFGVVVTVLVAIYSLVRLLFWEGDIWPLLACALHSLFLVLVILTHNKLLEDVNTSFIQLQEVTTILPTAPPLSLIEEDEYNDTQIIQNLVTAIPILRWINYVLLLFRPESQGAVVRRNIAPRSTNMLSTPLMNRA